MDRLRIELSRCLIEEMKKVDLSRLLRMSQLGGVGSATEKSVPDPPEPKSTADPHQPRHRQPTKCAAEGCDRPARSRGLCAMHYQREQYAAKRKKARSESEQPALSISTAPDKPDEKVSRTKRVGASTPSSTDPKCSHPECAGKVHAKGMCGFHFMEWVRAKKQKVPQLDSSEVRSKVAPTRLEKPEEPFEPGILAGTTHLRTKLCAFPGCGRRTGTRRFCAKHSRMAQEMEQQERMSPEAEPKDEADAPGAIPRAKKIVRRSSVGGSASSGGGALCGRPGCERAIFAKGLCTQHYMAQHVKGKRAN